MRTIAIRGVFVLAVALLGSAEAQQPKFYPDDPVLMDHDNLDVPEEPAEIELSDMFDRFGHIVADLGSPELTEAENVNTLDEVPDSSWFTNRHGVKRLTIPELIRGPNTLDGPDMSVPWQVFRSKIGGLTPGFQIIDGPRRSLRHKIRSRRHSRAELGGGDHRDEAVLRHRIQHARELHRGRRSRGRSGH